MGSIESAFILDDSQLPELLEGGAITTAQALNAFAYLLKSISGKNSWQEAATDVNSLDQINAILNSISANINASPLIIWKGGFLQQQLVDTNPFTIANFFADSGVGPQSILVLQLDLQIDVPDNNYLSETRLVVKCADNTIYSYQPLPIRKLISFNNSLDNAYTTNTFSNSYFLNSSGNPQFTGLQFSGFESNREFSIRIENATPGEILTFYGGSLMALNQAYSPYV